LACGAVVSGERPHRSPGAADPEAVLVQHGEGGRGRSKVAHQRHLVAIGGQAFGEQAVDVLVGDEWWPC
jgi:hypothetical protein